MLNQVPAEYREALSAMFLVCFVLGVAAGAWGQRLVAWMTGDRTPGQEARGEGAERMPRETD